ncbi:Vacuolar protein sorting-associated protein 41 [Zea mays]|uniref:Vacuolar protein sorting-associated protein 41 n=1 Tax=Zea mays TaxID=4577 RepID=A0A3L6E1V7_MAIZE|nr:Vacuolar protein sorting-associated protein 41 [Zea mays]
MSRCPSLPRAQSLPRLSQNRRFSDTMMLPVLGDQSPKIGVDPSGCVELAKHVRLNNPNLVLSGLMIIGMLDYSSTPKNFKALANCREDVCKELGIPEEQLELFVDMSSDFEQTIEMGSTNVQSSPYVLITFIAWSISEGSTQYNLSNHLKKKSLAELYVINGQYEKALSLYAELLKPEVFEFIEKYNLYDAIHDKVELYADYETRMLLPFLLTSQHYRLDKAYEIFAQKELAVEFVTEQHDDELWEELIRQCLQKPEMVGNLLEHTVGNLDPLYIVSLVPDGLEIPRLQDRLVKIVTDYRTETSL